MLAPGKSRGPASRSADNFDMHLPKLCDYFQRGRIASHSWYFSISASREIPLSSEEDVSGLHSERGC